jgi:hypothetical protein
VKSLGYHDVAANLIACTYLVLVKARADIFVRKAGKILISMMLKGKRLNSAI